MSDYEDAPNIGLLKYEHELRQICYGLQEENRKLRDAAKDYQEENKNLRYMVKDFYMALVSYLHLDDLDKTYLNSTLKKHEQFLKDNLK